MLWNPASVKMWSVNTWKIKSSRFGTRNTFWLIFPPKTHKHMHARTFAPWTSGVYCWIEVSGPQGTSFQTGSSVGAFVLSCLSPVWHVSVASANSAGLRDFHMCAQVLSSEWVRKNVLCPTKCSSSQNLSSRISSCKYQQWKPVERNLVWNLMNNSDYVSVCVHLLC